MGPESYARLAAALPGGTTPLTATDAQLAPYADKEFEYDSAQRVSKQVHADYIDRMYLGR